MTWYSLQVNARPEALATRVPGQFNPACSSRTSGRQGFAEWSRPFRAEWQARQGNLIRNHDFGLVNMAEFDVDLFGTEEVFGGFAPPEAAASTARGSWSPKITGWAVTA